MKLSGSNNRITLSANGKRAGVTVDAGPWIKGIDPNLIKLRCKRGIFPSEIREALVVENNSDSNVDYFEGDTIRLLPGHALYTAAQALAQ